MQKPPTISWRLYSEYGTRTRVTDVRGQCPRPLDELAKNRNSSKTTRYSKGRGC